MENTPRQTNEMSTHPRSEKYVDDKHDSHMVVLLVINKDSELERYERLTGDNY